MGMLQSEEEKEKKYKNTSRDDSTTPNSSFSTNLNHDNEKQSDSVPLSDINFEDAEHKIDEILNKTNKENEKTENNQQQVQNQTHENMTPEVKITNPPSEYKNKAAETIPDNSDTSTPNSNQKEELFEIQRSKQGKMGDYPKSTGEKNTSKTQVKKKQRSISFPKIHINKKKMKPNNTLKKPESQKKKKGFFSNDSVFNKKSKDITNNNRQLAFSQSSMPDPSISNRQSIQHVEPQLNDHESKQKPQKDDKKKFSFFSSKKNKTKKPPARKQAEVKTNNDVKTEKQLNNKTADEQEVFQTDKNKDCFQNPESFAKQNLDDDIKKVLSITDELLAQLPDQVIEDFAASEDFQLYQKVMSKYNIK